MPLETYALAGGQKVKLGKAPAFHDSRTLQLAKYIPEGALAAPPVSENFAKNVKRWPMMLNDRLGDCTCACVGHMLQQWTTYTTSSPNVLPDATIEKLYEAVGGYNPSDPNSDKGAVILNVLNYWRKTGVAGDKILAFAGLEPQNHEQIKDSIVLFGNCYIGVQLPLSAQNQSVWSVPPGGPHGQGAPGSWGGHAIPIVAYDNRGVTVVTWGALKKVTWQFIDTYCDEAFAVLSTDWINKVTKLTPDKFDLDTLQNDLNLIAKAKAANV